MLDAHPAPDALARPPRRPSRLLFRTLFDDGFPRLFHAVAARISNFIWSLPDRRADGHGL